MTLIVLCTPERRYCLVNFTTSTPRRHCSDNSPIDCPPLLLEDTHDPGNHLIWGIVCSGADIDLGERPRSQDILECRATKLTASHYQTVEESNISYRDENQHLGLLKCALEYLP